MNIKIEITDSKISAYLKHYAESKGLDSETAASKIIEDYLLEHYPTNDFVERFGDLDKD